MTDERVRMHLAQALTRAENANAVAHIQAALTVLDEQAVIGSVQDSETQQIAYAETALEHWLVAHATAGVPETVLVGLLRTYAERVDRIGHVPRSWQLGANSGGVDDLPNGGQSMIDRR
jgi:hypothetical protein